MPHVFPAEGGRSNGYDIFCAAQERSSDLISARLPSHRNGDSYVERHQVSGRWTFNLHWFHQLDHTHRYVQLLSADRIQSGTQEQCVVEEIHNANANCKFIKYTFPFHDKHSIYKSAFKIQFLMITSHWMSLWFVPDCGYPKWPVPIMVSQNLLMLVLFGNFYRKNYLQTPKAKAPKLEANNNTNTQNNNYATDLNAISNSSIKTNGQRSENGLTKRH